MEIQGVVTVCGKQVGVLVGRLADQGFSMNGSSFVHGQTTAMYWQACYTSV